MSLRARTILVGALVALIGFFAVSGFVPEETRRSSGVLFSSVQAPVS